VLLEYGAGPDELLGYGIALLLLGYGMALLLLRYGMALLLLGYGSSVHELLETG